MLNLPLLPNVTKSRSDLVSPLTTMFIIVYCTVVSGYIKSGTYKYFFSLNRPLSQFSLYVAMSVDVLFVHSSSTRNRMDWRLLVKERIDKLKNKQPLFF